ncbi:hypothetical protein GPSY_2693 [Paraglaciecola psychrophila 170]|nr:hypothetical protein GPSY_2693 [Paraglaciecola psychrophila 170]
MNMTKPIMLARILASMANRMSTACALRIGFYDVQNPVQINYF